MFKTPMFTLTKYYGSGFGLDGIYYPERSRYKNAYLPQKKKQLTTKNTIFLLLFCVSGYTGGDLVSCTGFLVVSQLAYLPNPTLTLVPTLVICHQNKKEKVRATHTDNSLKLAN